MVYVYVPQKNLLPDYKFVALPAYWEAPVKHRPKSLVEIYDKLAKPHECLWEFKTTYKKTGEVIERSIHKNVITDKGAIAMLKNTWNNAGSAVGIFNRFHLSPNGCATRITGATGTSAITTLAVESLPAALADNDQLTLGYGGANEQTVQVNNGAGYAIGATSITVDSFTPAINFPANTALVANPKYTDNPSSVSNTVDSGALAGGDFTFTETTGLGNRQVAIHKIITGTTGNAGQYTEAYTSNAATIATNATASHLIFPAKVLNDETNQDITIVEKA